MTVRKWLNEGPTPGDVDTAVMGELLKSPEYTRLRDAILRRTMKGMIALHYNMMGLPVGDLERATDALMLHLQGPFYPAICEREGPLAILTGGGASVGKTYAINQMLPRRGLIWMDCDNVRLALPDQNYDHATSINRKIYRLCIDNRLSFLIDGTMARHGDKVIEQIGEMKETGYTVVVHFFVCDIEVALERNQERDLVLPETWIRESPMLARDTFDRAKPMIDAWKQYDTTRGLCALLCQGGKW